MWRNECAWSCEEMRVCNITLNIITYSIIYIYTHTEEQAIRMRYITLLVQEYS